MIKVKRAYEEPSRGDGYRVLVERLWPRGVRKQDLPLDCWQKELAPSPALRRWFGHDPLRWQEFRRRYRRELRAPEAKAHLQKLAARAARGTITLVFAARDEEHNSAVALKWELQHLPRVARSRA
jgi:uncharacterized protein YeaO (DUF488 family)